jgi:hypothetical protein
MAIEGGASTVVSYEVPEKLPARVTVDIYKGTEKASTFQFLRLGSLVAAHENTTIAEPVVRTLFLAKKEVVTGNFA